jgi:hypothetical protein
MLGLSKLMLVYNSNNSDNVVVEDGVIGMGECSQFQTGLGNTGRAGATPASQTYPL